MRRVVVTGVGAVSPCGLDTESTWESICAGRSGIGRIEGFDASTFASQIAGECSGFDVEQFFEKKRVREGDRFIHLAMAASTHAVKSSGLEVSGDAAERVGTFIGVGMAGLKGLYDTSIRLRDRGPRRISPFFIPSVITNLAPGQVSMRFGYKGPSYTTTSACSSGAHAIGDAARPSASEGADPLGTHCPSGSKRCVARNASHWL